MENIRKKETIARNNILLLSICSLRKIKRIKSFTEEFSIAANNPTLLSLSAFKVQLRCHYFQELTLNLHIGPGPFSAIFWVFPTKALPTLAMDLCPHEVISFLRTCSVAYSFQCPWCQSQHTEHRRNSTNVCASELKNQKHCYMWTYNEKSNSVIHRQ